MRIATAILALGGLAARAQSFEAATVRVAAPITGYGQTITSGDRVVYTSTTLLSVLMRSYGLASPQHVIGPSWISSDLYDIVAKAPDGTPKDQLPLMMQHLLIERFNLVLHHETRDQDAYLMTVGKGRLKLQEVKDPAVEDQWGMNADGPVAKSVSMAAWASRLRLMVHAPVVDRTGLKGYYSFPIGWTDEDTRRDSSPSAFTVVEQLGLKLEARKLPFDVIVIDSGNKVPTDN